MTDLSEILATVRKIELLTRGIVREAVGGEYHSVFKGQGIDFDEFREYQPGDEVRRIDWNVTARMGFPYIKKFVEEREMTVFVVVDLSPSMFVGKLESKRKLAAQLAAIFACSAAANQDKVGLALFTNGVESYIPPSKGHRTALRMIREILSKQTEGKGSDPTVVLERLTNQLTKRALVVLISDFLTNNFETALSVCAVRHDVVAVQVSDINEARLPDIGRFIFEDIETGKMREINTSNKKVRAGYHQNRATWQQALDAQFKRLRIDKIDVMTESDPIAIRDKRPSWVPPVHSFFKKRAARR